MPIISFSDITKNTDLVLFNNAPNYELDLVSGQDYDEEIDEYIDVFQYFAVSRPDGEYISDRTNLPLYYSEQLDLYILGVTFYGTSWDGIEFDIE